MFSLRLELLVGGQFGIFPQCSASPCVYLCEKKRGIQFHSTWMLSSALSLTTNESGPVSICFFVYLLK